MYVNEIASTVDYKKKFIQKDEGLLHALREKDNLNIGARVHIRLVYNYLLNVPSVSSPYFNKIKQMSHLGK